MNSIDRDIVLFRLFFSGFGFLSKDLQKPLHAMILKNVWRSVDATRVKYLMKKWTISVGVCSKFDEEDEDDAIAAAYEEFLKLTPNKSGGSVVDRG